MLVVIFVTVFHLPSRTFRTTTDPSLIVRPSRVGSGQKPLSQSSFSSFPDACRVLPGSAVESDLFIYCNNSTQFELIILCTWYTENNFNKYITKVFVENNYKPYEIQRFMLQFHFFKSIIATSIKKSVYVI